MNVFYDYTISIGSSVIDGVSSVNMTEGAQVQSPQLDGLSAPVMSYITGFDQGIDFSSTQVNSLLTLLTSSSDCTIGKGLDSTDKGLIYFQPAAEKGTREAGAVNEKYTINSGILIPTSLSASGNSPAGLSTMLYPLYDGTNNPIVPQGSQALPDYPTTPPGELYYAGPVYINNTLIEGIQSINIRFGIAIKKLVENGEADASFSWIEFRNPVISITTTDATAFRTFSRGVEVTAKTKVHLRAGNKVGSRQALSSAVHPTFTVYKGMVVATSISGSPKTTTIEITPNEDIVNANPLLGYALEAIGAA